MLACFEFALGHQHQQCTACVAGSVSLAPSNADTVVTTMLPITRWPHITASISVRGQCLYVLLSPRYRMLLVRLIERG